MNKQHASRYILSVFGMIAILLLFSFELNVAHADTATTGAQVSIGGNGQAMVRNAKVISISGSSITAVTSWGSTSFTWTINTTGSTHFFPDEGTKAVLKAIKIGDLIGFTGDMDTAAGHPTVNASVVRDSALVQDGATIIGDVVSINTSAKDVTLKTENGTTTIVFNSGTILTRDGNPVTLADLKAGDSVRAFGSLNLVTKVLVADKITYSTSTDATQADTKVAVGLGFFGNLMRWLHGTSGIMTIK